MFDSPPSRFIIKPRYAFSEDVESYTQIDSVIAFGFRLSRLGIIMRSFVPSKSKARFPPLTTQSLAGSMSVSVP